MLLPRLRKIPRAGLAFGLVGLVLFGLLLAPQPGAQARVGELPLWQDDGYPPPQDTGQPPYPPPEDATEPPGEGYPPPDGQATPSFTPTPPSPPTKAPADQTSVPVTVTAQPSPTASATVTFTVFPQVSPEAEQEDEPETFQMDWGLFWIGFAVPILASSGVVLYLLDRRPDLFRPRAKR